MFSIIELAANVILLFAMTPPLITHLFVACFKRCCVGVKEREDEGTLSNLSLDANVDGIDAESDLRDDVDDYSETQYYSIDSRANKNT